MIRKLPLFASLLTLASGVVTADWPMFRGVDQTGISPERNWLGAWPGGQPKQLWKKNVGTGYSSMSVAAGRVKGASGVFTFSSSVIFGCSCVGGVQLLLVVAF